MRHELRYWLAAGGIRPGWFARVWRIVLPAALPLIFTGLRLSLGVGWMVLIAAEMLAQNPGLGKFVWDMFQNGSSQTLARIMVAVFAIGLIGFALDRIMLSLQRATLGPSFQIDIPRPRDRKALLEDALYYKLREEIIGFLNERSHLKPAPPMPPATAPAADRTQSTHPVTPA